MELAVIAIITVKPGTLDYTVLHKPEILCFIKQIKENPMAAHFNSPYRTTVRRATCRTFRISHTTFYRWKRRFDQDGVRGLENRSRAPIRRRKSTVSREHVSLVVKIRKEYPACAGKTYYQFTAVDCCTRLGYMKVYPSAASKWASDFLSHLVEFLPFSVSGVQTDNGSEYLGSFDSAVREAGIDHYFSYPCCPKHNARVERKIQTSEYEFWDFNAGYAVEELNELANKWNYIYNLKRPHQSLRYLTPVEYMNSLGERSKQKGKVSTM